MGFIAVKNNLITFLGTEAGSDFIVIGYQPPPQNSGSISKQLSVRYKKGSNPRNVNSMSADIEHLVTFELNLTVAVDASADLSTIDNEQSSTQQIATAISNIDSANKIADDTMDTFYSQILSIVMTPDHYDLGNDPNEISDRWLDDFEKSDIFEDGETAVVYGRCYLTLYTDETMDDPETANLEQISGQVTTVNIEEDEEDTYTQTVIEENH